ncbi:uncharacterized protein LOC109595792 [Aethina tumida]|uniref:uncharacterized protein LOC109595792 n=1 Tax=Aethina tumida TaxID=116153 RepID=UPI00096B0EFB|nr:uncharacterized protein LOC109595792 [Aethina tumida]
MFATGKVSQLLARSAVKGTRNMSALSGPPQEKISSAEKFVHGVTIAVGMLVIPAWVLANIKNYRAQSS